MPQFQTKYIGFSDSYDILNQFAKNFKSAAGFELALK